MIVESVSVDLFVEGNYMALSLEQIKSVPVEEYNRRLSRAYELLVDCGCHYVIDSVEDLMPVVHDINARMARGERP